MTEENPYAPPVETADAPAAAAALPYDATYEPGGGRATVSIVMLYIAALVELINIAGAAYIHVMMGRVSAGQIFTPADVTTVTVVETGSAVLTLLVRAACAIPFCMWFYRVYKNLRAFGHVTAYGPGWAPGSFFVPFLNLVRPFQIAREIWVASPAEYDARSGLVSLWWAFFIGSGIIGYIAGKIGGSDPSASSVQTMEIVSIISSLLSLGAAIACVQMVKGIEQRQADRARQLAAG